MTQFLSPVSYNKTEDLPPGGTDMLRYSHLLLGLAPPSANLAELRPYTSTHSVLAVIPAFHRLEFRGREFPPWKVLTRPAIHILKRNPVM